MSTTVVIPPAGLTFKGRNGYAKLAHAAVYTFSDQTTGIGFYSKRYADAAPMYLEGSPIAVLQALDQLTTAIRAQVPHAPSADLDPYTVRVIVWQSRTDPDDGGTVLGYALPDRLDTGARQIEVIRPLVSDDYSPVQAGGPLYLFDDEILEVLAPQDWQETAPTPLCPRCRRPCDERTHKAGGEICYDCATEPQKAATA